MSTKPRAVLALENGLIFEGFSFGAEGEASGEIVFHTGMSGYQEILTDPSYKGQMVLMTYPHIGNTGINDDDDESGRIHLEALIVKEYCDIPSNWRSKKSLKTFLKEFDVPAIEGIDTRYLTRVLRKAGSLRAILSTRPNVQEIDGHSLVERAKTLPKLDGQNLARSVTTPTPYSFPKESGHAKHHVVAFDLGIKKSIIDRLVERQCKVTVIPCTTTPNEVLKLKPDGIFLSNGPGDPAAVTEMPPTIRKLIGKKPIFGICLGHQILAISLGATTSKLKFGHHGANHPVQFSKTKAVEVTSQNHSFVVDLNTLPDSIEVTHMNLNDHTVEGYRDRNRNLLSIQYHPEAAPGPHDSYYVFDEFVQMMKEAQ